MEIARLRQYANIARMSAGMIVTHAGRFLQIGLRKPRQFRSPVVHAGSHQVDHAFLAALHFPFDQHQSRRHDRAPLQFEQPDLATFRCLELAFQALRAGGDAPAVLNAANEVAVDAFLAGALPFLSIADVVEAVLAELPAQAVVDVGTLAERDRVAREAARRILRNAC